MAQFEVGADSQETTVHKWKADVIIKFSIYRYFSAVLAHPGLTIFLPSLYNIFQKDRSKKRKKEKNLGTNVMYWI